MDLADRAELRRRILRNIKRFKANCLAWAFLPNHFHLLYHSASGNLADFMRCLMSGYSIYFNRKYERSGHLFQNRYKSTVVDTERYLLELIRYIHLNPIRSGNVTSLETLSQYPWTGHHEIIEAGRLPWEGFPFIQEFFSSHYVPGMDIYLSYLEEGLWRRPGESCFQDEMAQADCHRQPRDRSMDVDMNGPSGIFLTVVGNVTSRLRVSKDRILNGRRDRISCLARREILNECVSGKGMALKSVSRWLGITQAGGSYLLRSADRARVEEIDLPRD